MVQGVVCFPQAPIGHTHHAAKWHVPSRVPKNVGSVPATAAVVLAATQRASASKSSKKSQNETLEEVILALTSTSTSTRPDSRSIIAQLEKLRMLRRETMTWQAAAKLLDTLEKVLDSFASLGPPLPLDACVTALIAAANAQALQRRKLSAERLDVFCQAFQRSLNSEPSKPSEPSEIEQLPELLSYGLWALVKLGDRGSPVLQRLLQRSIAEMQRFESAHLSRLVWSLATATIRDGQILSSLAHRTQQARLHPQLGLAMLAWSFAKLRFKEAGLMESISLHACGHVKLFKISELSNITWAFATQQVPFATASPLFSAVSETAVRGLEKFKHQELAMLLWSYAKLKIVERKLISAASEEVLKRISPESTGGAVRAQHLANFAWAFAKMRPDRSDRSDRPDRSDRSDRSGDPSDPSEVVMRLAALALQRAEELKPLELASLVWALAQLAQSATSAASTRLAMHLTKEASTRRMKPQESKP